MACFQTFDLISFQRSNFRIAAHGADTAADHCSGCVFCNCCKVRCFSGLQIACRNFQTDACFQLVYDPQRCFCTFFFHLDQLLVCIICCCNIFSGCLVLDPVISACLIFDDLPLLCIIACVFRHGRIGIQISSLDHK